MTKSPSHAEMARRGRLGALTTHSRHDPVELTRKARAIYAASFAEDHSGCGICGYPAPIPADLTAKARAKRADALRRAHYLRLSLRSRAARAQRRCRDRDR